MPDNEIAQLERDIRTGERWLIGINGFTALMSLVIALIYYGQLCQMQKATKATQMAAEAAKQSADLSRKQMEGVSAAIVEMPHGFSITFPIGEVGEARTNI